MTKEEIIQVVKDALQSNVVFANGPNDNDYYILDEETKLCLHCGEKLQMKAIPGKDGENQSWQLICNCLGSLNERQILQEEEDHITRIYEARSDRKRKLLAYGLEIYKKNYNDFRDKEFEEQKQRDEIVRNLIGENLWH